LSFHATAQKQVTASAAAGVAWHQRPEGRPADNFAKKESWRCGAGISRCGQATIPTKEETPYG